MSMKLYYFESCPFCRKVLSFLEKHEHEVELIDVKKNNLAKEELIKLNEGVFQVPCLVVDGKPMLESDSIIEFLKEKLN
jgi:glutaredoxin 3